MAIRYGFCFLCLIFAGCATQPAAGPIHVSHVKALATPCEPVIPLKDGDNLKTAYPNLLSLYGDCMDKVNGHLGRARILSRG